MWPWGHEILLRAKRLGAAFATAHHTPVVHAVDGVHTAGGEVRSHFRREALSGFAFLEFLRPARAPVNR
jgi:hypothetical protein